MVIKSRFKMEINPIYHILFFISVLLLAGSLIAQQIESNVQIMLERLPLEKQEHFKDLADDVEQYLNDYSWTEEDFEEPIPLTVQIFLEDRSSSIEDRFSGTFLISNGQDLQYYDKYWLFPLQYGQMLEHNEGLYHPFTGFIDFYVYLIFAGEYDKFGKLLGSRFYEKAQLLKDHAMFNAQYARGWEEREELIEQLLSEENKQFRLMKDQFFLGLDYLGDEDETARKYCREAVQMLDKVLLDNPEHQEALNFLKAYHAKMIEVFKEDKDTLKLLSEIDPERADTYLQGR